MIRARGAQIGSLWSWANARESVAMPYYSRCSYWRHAIRSDLSHWLHPKHGLTNAGQTATKWTQCYASCVYRTDRVPVTWRPPLETKRSSDTAKLWDSENLWQTQSNQAGSSLVFLNQFGRKLLHPLFGNCLRHSHVRNVGFLSIERYPSMIGTFKYSVVLQELLVEIHPQFHEIPSRRVYACVLVQMGCALLSAFKRLRAPCTRKGNSSLRLLPFRHT